MNFDQRKINTGPSIRIIIVLAVCLLIYPSLLLLGQDTTAEKSQADKYEIESLVIHPIYTHKFISIEHPKGTEEALGDRLGRDFIIISVRNPRKPYPVAYKNNGKSNEDWYGWRQKVLSPVSGIVKDIVINEETNKPGEFGKSPASSVTIKKKNGVHVKVVHVREVSVKEGARVKAGEVLARVGNNGHSFNPHIHIGAWKGNMPLQIQVDLKKMGQMINS